MSSGKIFTKGPCEQKPKQPTLLTVTLSLKSWAIIASSNFARILAELLDKQPVPPQITIARLPFVPANFASKLVVQSAILVVNSFSLLIIILHLLVDDILQ